MQIKKYLRIIGLLLFIYILYKINFRELLLTLKDLNLSYFLLALILWFSTFVLKILKWKTLVDSQNIKISLNNLLKISFKGLYLGTITPGKLGEFWRAKYLTENSGVSNGKAFYTTLMDRLVDLIIITIISLIGIVVIFLLYQVEIGWTAIISILILIILIIYFLTKKENTKRILKYLVKNFLPQSLKAKTNYFLEGLFRGLEELKPGLFLKLLGYGLGYYWVAVLVYYVITLSLGVIIPLWYLFFIVALVWLILALPVTILGLGTREASYIFFFSIFGITFSQAVAFSLLILVCNIILAVPGLILILKKY